MTARRKRPISWLLDEVLGRPRVRRALGLHSPSLAVLGECGCRTCRRLAALPPAPPMQGPLTVAQALAAGGVWHHDDGCEVCDERRVAVLLGGDQP